jgi:hypothetical protein
LEQGLDTGHLVRADHAFAVRDTCRHLPIDGAHLSDLVIALFVIDSSEGEQRHRKHAPAVA